MIKEMEKARPNLAIPEDLMRRTSAGRAKAIMETSGTAASMEEFVFLRIPSLISMNICMKLIC